MTPGVVGLGGGGQWGSSKRVERKNRNGQDFEVQGDFPRGVWLVVRLGLWAQSGGAPTWGGNGPGRG